MGIVNTKNSPTKLANKAHNDIKKQQVAKFKSAKLALEQAKKTGNKQAIEKAQLALKLVAKKAILKTGNKVVNGKVVVISQAQKQAMKNKLSAVKNIETLVKSQEKAVEESHK